MIWHFLPLAGVVLLLVITCCLRPLLQLRRYGTYGVVLFRTRNLKQNLRDFSLIVFGLLIAGQAVVAAIRSQSLRLLVTEPATYNLLRGAGAIVFLCGIALVATAQLHLGASWRIGIDEGAKPGLVTSGLYRSSRNPIYLGLLVTIAGYAALLPTLLSVGLLFGAYVGIRAQTAAEEAYLLRAYGDAYRDYARRVGRFLPGLGTL